jgi:hypothetical protein
MNDLPLLAYIDPASGFILLQVIAGGVIGAIVYFRQTIAKVMGFVTGRGASADANESKTDETK